MSLRKKTFLILFISFLLLTAAVTTSSNYIFTNKFKKIEESIARKNITLARAVLDHKLEFFENFIVDWAAWDETYQFTSDHNNEYIIKNLVPSTFSEQNISAIIIADSEGKVIWSGQLNSDSGKIDAVDPGLLKNIPFYIQNTESQKIQSGQEISWASDKLYAINYHKITNNDHSKDSRGIFVTARLINDNFLNDISKRTPTKIELILIPHIRRTNPKQKNLIQNLLTSSDFPESTVIEEDGDNITGYSFIPDASGNGGILMCAIDDLSVLQKGREALQINGFTLIILCLISVTIIMAIFERFFLSKIALLTGSINMMENADAENIENLRRISGSGKDEISELTESIISFTTELKDNRTFLDTVINSVESGILIVDPDDGKILLMNQTANKIVGCNTGANFKNICGKDVELEAGSSQLCSFNSVNNESIATIRSVSQVTRDGRKLMLVTLTDISELLDAQKSVRLSEQTYKTIFRNTGTASIMIDEEMNIILANREFANMAGISRHKIEGQMKWPQFFHPTDAERMLIYHQLRRKEQSLAPRSYEARFIDGDQRIRYVQLTVGMMPDGINSIASMLDITEQKDAARKLSYQTFHDTLTSLPNRFLLIDRLEQSIKAAQRNNKLIGIFMIDLDRFKNINDSMGHTQGDQILRQVSQRLATALRKRDTLSRFGGDEFIIIIEDATHESAFANIASKLLESLSIPFTINEKEVFIQASIGISIYPADGDNCEDLIKNADLAMYRSKESGRNRYSMFTRELDLKTREKVKIEQELRVAISNQDIDVHFQPIVDLKTGKISKLEALARWTDSKGQMRSPEDFIPVAEDCGLILQLDRIVALKSCLTLNKINEKAKTPIQLAINLSAKHFETSKLPELLINILDDMNFDKELLTVEITETSIMENMQRAVPILNRIREAGISVSLDDFGTGYSSLQYLQKMPITYLKIDKSFTAEVADNDDDSSRKLVQAVISMAEGMSLKVIAEGVETRAQLDFMLENGCDYIQGYYISKPVPEEDLFELLDTDFVTADWKPL